MSSAPQDNNVTYIKIQPTDSLIDENGTTEKEPFRESKIEKLELSIPGNVSLENEFTRHIETVDFTTELEPDTTIYITTEEPTTKQPEKITKKPERRRTFKPSPRFVSKLSYYNSPNLNSSPNLIDGAVSGKVEKYEKRKFRSRCRCEKIWNCPKLQITVPRCPDEYFLCCF